MNFDDFHFVRVWVLALLALLPLVFFLMRGDRARRGKWTSLVDEHLRPYVLTSRGEQGSRSFGALWYLLAAALIVALAGPAWEKVPQPVYVNQQPMVIALDLSRSMLAQDVLPNRLQLAKIRIQDLLRERAEGQTALLGFAGDAFTVTPMSDDAATITALLPSLTPDIMPVQGSKIEPALELAGELLEQSSSTMGHVVVLTDGLTDTNDAQAMARSLVDRNYRVSVVSFGTTQGDMIRGADGQFLRDARGEIVVARVPVEGLRAVSQSGRGVFVEGKSNFAALSSFLTAENIGFDDAVSELGLAADLWNEQGPLILLFCLPLIALAFRRGWLLSVAVVFIFPWQLAEASPLGDVWSDLWLRPDQQGQKKFEQEKYAEAAPLFESAEHRAAALYRDQQYAESAAALSGIGTATANYNRGNALAHAGEIQGAISAYESALTLEPDHADAQHNLEILQQMKQDQEQEQQEQDKQDQQDQEQQQEQQDQQQSGEESEQQQSSEEQSEQGEEEQESEQEQESEPQDSEEQQSEEERLAELSEQMTEEEKQQAVEQWLRRIPDDPGGLLRRKFARQHQIRRPSPIEEEQPW